LLKVGQIIGLENSGKFEKLTMVKWSICIILNNANW
jgi:hypothetical protein